jgi:hypothetical protein
MDDLFHYGYIFIYTYYTSIDVEGILDYVDAKLTKVFEGGSRVC